MVWGKILSSVGWELPSPPLYEVMAIPPQTLNPSMYCLSELPVQLVEKRLQHRNNDPPHY